MKSSDGGSVSGCSFVNNNGLNGGAIFWYESSDGGSVSGCSFVNNNGLNGGAICWSGSDGVLSGCSFVKHNAEDIIIYFSNGMKGNSLTVNSNIFLDNACPIEIYFV